MVRYYAAQPITSKALHQALQAVDPAFKIDLGELLKGDVSLGQVEVNQASGDLFEDDLRTTIRTVEATGQGAAVVPRLRASRAVVVADLDWGDRGPDATLAMVAPLWTALRQLSPGLAQWDGHGIYDGDHRLVAFS
jgi:hypothetical protein